ncbi:DNA-directed DNA polymerase [Tanacetum coccineum]
MTKTIGSVHDMSKTQGDYGSGVTRPTINQDTHFEFKEQFLKELHDNTFSVSKHEDANEHIEKVLEFVDLFDIPTVTQDQIMLRAFPGAIPSKTTADAKIAIQEMAEYSQTQEWHNGTSSRTRSTETFNGLATIQSQLNNLGRKIKKVNGKVYAAQFGAPYQPGGQYRAAGLGFYQRNNGNSSCDDWREAQDVKILDAYDHTLPQKEKDPGSFTLPCLIYNICFDKALVDLGASVSVMPFSTYTNLGLGILSHTRLTIELADRTIKQPRGIAKNVLVRIGKFIFPIDFIILDIPEDDDVPLILGRPCLSTAYSKIDVIKRKITLRVGEEKLVFKSFTIIDGDDLTKDVVLDMKFCKKYASCQMIMKKFALGDKCERIMEDELIKEKGRT